MRTGRVPNPETFVLSLSSWGVGPFLLH